jgi:2-dehydro-3-deoxyphosphogluconate aldolase/(4S)-4-hydroxy-2-oxoglutarate aldolase
VVGIIRGMSMQEVMDILPLYVNAGFTTIEFTLNTADVVSIIQAAQLQYNGKLNIGAGTVCDMNDLDKALKAGAQFIVAPIVNEEVIRACVDLSIPVFPGAYTATEIYKAWSLGAEMVKVFPATSLGPAYIKDIKAPFNQIKLMPVGGIDLQNCLDFMKVGSDGLGVGSQLFNKKMIQEKNWAQLTEQFEAFANKVKNYLQEVE